MTLKAHASYTMGRLIELRSVLNFCQDILIPPKKKNLDVSAFRSLQYIGDKSIQQTELEFLRLLGEKNLEGPSLHFLSHLCQALLSSSL